MHTIKCLQAIRKIDELLVLPTKLTTHSPFLICMIANVTIANLSACRLVLQGKDLVQHRERIRLTLGTLKTLSQYWTLGKRTYEEISIIAHDHLSLASKKSPSATDKISLFQDCAIPTQPSASVSQPFAADFDACLNNEIPLEYFDNLQEPTLDFG